LELEGEAGLDVAAGRREEAMSTSGTPPGFGAGGRRLAFIEVMLADGQEMTLVAKAGMPVAPGLHEHYWSMLAQIGRMLREADERCIEVNEYVLYKADAGGVLRPYGIGRCAGADAHYLAWLACAFREMDGLRFAITIPDDIPADAFGLGKMVRVRDDGAEGLRMEEEAE
jgi:hypothetical protein